MLLVAVVSVPVFASDDGIYNPADYMTGKPEVSDDGVITYTYDFGITPLVRVLEDGSIIEDIYSDNFSYYPTVGTTKTTFRVYPLGVYMTSGRPMTSGVIDVSDFVSYSQFDLSSTFHIGVSSVYQTDGTLEARWFWTVYCYDNAGWFNGAIQSETFSQEKEITSSSVNGFGIDAGGSLQLPENTEYILPFCVLSLYSPATNESSYYAVSVSDLTISFSIDSVLENTLTMQAIQNQLGELGDKIDDTNGKLDDIISGSDEDIVDGESTRQEAEDNAAEFDEAIGKLEDATLPNWDDITQEHSIFENAEAIANVTLIFAPFYNWQLWQFVSTFVLMFAIIATLLGIKR